MARTNFIFVINCLSGARRGFSWTRVGTHCTSFCGTTLQVMKDQQPSLVKAFRSELALDTLADNSYVEAKLTTISTRRYFVQRWPRPNRNKRAHRVTISMTKIGVQRQLLEFWPVVRWTTIRLSKSCRDKSVQTFEIIVVSRKLTCDRQGDAVYLTVLIVDNETLRPFVGGRRRKVPK